MGAAAIQVEKPVSKIESEKRALVWSVNSPFKNNVGYYEDHENSGGGWTSGHKAAEEFACELKRLLTNMTENDKSIQIDYGKHTLQGGKGEIVVIRTAKPSTEQFVLQLIAKACEQLNQLAAKLDETELKEDDITIHDLFGTPAHFSISTPLHDLLLGYMQSQDDDSPLFKKYDYGVTFPRTIDVENSERGIRVSAHLNHRLSKPFVRELFDVAAIKLREDCTKFTAGLTVSIKRRENLESLLRQKEAKARKVKAKEATLNRKIRALEKKRDKVTYEKDHAEAEARELREDRFQRK